MLTLTLSQARRILFARQGLGLLASKDHAMRAMVAVQTQYAKSLNQALAARSAASEAEYEDRGLRVDGHLVKSWTLRGTVHTHTRDDFRMLLDAIGLNRYRSFRASLVRWVGLSEDEYGHMEQATLEELDKGPLSRVELHARVPSLKRIPWSGWGADVKGLAYLGKISFVGVGADQRFARLHGFEPSDTGLAELARRYFMSCGPATAQDFRYWVGAPAKDVKTALDAIKGELYPVQIEGLLPQRFLIGEVEAVEPREATLLAKFDPLTMAHRDRSILFPEECLPRIFRIAGQIEAVFLLRGEAAGTWRLTKKANGIIVSLEPWRKLFRYEIKALQREAGRLANSLGVKDSEIHVPVL